VDKFYQVYETHLIDGDSKSKYRISIKIDRLKGHLPDVFVNKEVYGILSNAIHEAKSQRVN